MPSVNRAAAQARAGRLLAICLLATVPSVACGPAERYSRTPTDGAPDAPGGLDGDPVDIAPVTDGEQGTGGGGVVAGTGGRGSGGSPGTGGAAGAAGRSGTSTGGNGSGGAATGGTGTGGAGSGGSVGTGGQGTGGSAARVISVDFVGGRTSAGGAGGAVLSGTTAMSATEIAGVRAAPRWNSATGTAGSLAGLTLSDGSVTAAGVVWNAPTSPGNAGTWTIGYADAEGDVRMMNGYLDAAWATLPATAANLVTVSGLPASITGPRYDVYVYVLGDVPAADMRSYQYAIGTTSFGVDQTGPVATTATIPYPYTAAPNPGMGNYIVFRGLTGASFTLTARPISATGNRFRAPVNGLQIVSPTGF